MILPLLFALAQIAASADHLNSGPEGFTVNSPNLPTEYANSPLPCASGLKLQRYHRGLEDATVSADAVFRGPTAPAPTGWYDVDATKPHDGDYRCVREPEGKPGTNGADADAGTGDIQGTPDRNLSHYPSPSAVITYAPYDQAGHEFPPHPSAGETWHGFRWDGQAWKFIPAETGMRDCPADQHLHPAAMSTFMPDTQGGPLPKADGLCHRNDNTDAPVTSHGRKLEAKR